MATVCVLQKKDCKIEDELQQLEPLKVQKYLLGKLQKQEIKRRLSENAEYDAVKEAQGLLEIKIAKLEEIVSNARVVDSSKLDITKR